MTKNIVVGLGRSGIGAAKLLRSKGESVILIEQKKTEEYQNKAAYLRQQGILVELGVTLDLISLRPWIENLESVIVGPGIAWDHPTLNTLRRLGIKIRGEIQIAWEAMQSIPWIGITGTNGKTTVTYLLSHVLQNAGLRAPMGGNVGFSATEIALEINMMGKPIPDWLVMELSSYQIESAPTITPKIGIWTTLTPDHLERHGTLDLYRKIKRSLLEHSEEAIFNADDPDLRLQRSSWNRGVWVSADGPKPDGKQVDYWIDQKGIVQSLDGKLFHSQVLSMPGNHNLQNLLLVTAASRLIGLSSERIEAGMRSFPGIPHRLELVANLNGTSVFNDSKATNYAAAEVGLLSMSSPVVVIAGGQTKIGNAEGWLSQLRRKASVVILFGSGAEELQMLIESAGYTGEIKRCEDLASAVKISLSAIRRSKASSLLLSPACASFDQYRDFEARGEHFRKLILELI